MFLAWRKPDDIAGVDFFDRPAFALHSAGARQNNQGLPKRMRVPRRARAGLEGYGRT